MPENAGADGYWTQIDAYTLEINIIDNGIFDSDNAANLIKANIVVAQPGLSLPPIFYLLL